MHVTFSAGHRDKENILVGCIIPSTGTVFDTAQSHSVKKILHQGIASWLDQ